MRERVVETRLCVEVKKRGGMSPKFVSPGYDGMPDRIVMFPRGKIAFVECKAPGEKPRPLQQARHEMLRRLGFMVFVIDRVEQIGGVLDAICTA